MALNATAALAMAAELGLDLDTRRRGVGRLRRRAPALRVPRRGRRRAVYDDYAHHPTEVAAQLTRGPGRWSGDGGRLVAVFQPGTYSRTQTFAREFAEAMAIADVAVVMDIFPAREEPIPGVTGATIADLIDLPPDRVVYEPRYDALPERIAALARPGDVVVTMGIGNVYLLCDDIREAVGRALGGAGVMTISRDRP